MTGRLIHLNGAPGVGKSTLAALWAARHPGTLCCDIDRLRSFLGGWQDDHAATGARVRPLALAMISTHVAAGGDVLLPQMLANEHELDRFVASAHSVGGSYIGILLRVSEDLVVERWRERDISEATTATNNRVIVEQGGDAVVLGWARRLEGVAASRPDLTVITLDGLDVEGALESIDAVIVGAR